MESEDKFPIYYCLWLDDEIRKATVSLDKLTEYTDKDPSKLGDVNIQIRLTVLTNVKSILLEARDRFRTEIKQNNGI